MAAILSRGVKDGRGGGVSEKKITSCYTFTMHKVCWRKHKNYIIVSVPVSINLVQKN